MFKLKDIFKIAVVGAAGYFGGQLAGPTGKKIGSALGQSLMSRGSGGGGSGGSQQYVTPPNLSRFGNMPTYASNFARSDMIPGSMRVVDGIAMNGMWERRLDKYLLRKKAIEQTIVKV
tara:strand:- start:236 stop:589 length:354 start_codon:yes stop_codon:yes gene_type:complete